jgi:hypothetical protein
MRIRWNPVQVVEAADQLDVQVKKIAKPLMRARKLAEKGTEIPNLPDYVKYRFRAFMDDIERVIGGVEHTGYHWQDGQSTSYQYTSRGSLEQGIEAIRKEVPEDALAEVRSRPPLFKGM